MEIVRELTNTEKRYLAAALQRNKELVEQLNRIRSEISKIQDEILDGLIAGKIDLEKGVVFETATVADVDDVDSGPDDE